MEPGPSTTARSSEPPTDAQLEGFRRKRDGLPSEELRLALVLNGGVSLAVWMGGVAHEIDRLTRSGASGDAAREGYGAVLGAARTTVVVDVISGTSAGGINGAALALAQANRHADLRSLRTLWAEQGRMEELLRRPFQGEPTSLLKGDDYFLPELHRAMQMLARPYEAPDKPPQIHLTLTTTLLKGGQEVTVDDFGEVIPQRIHAGTFDFSNVGEGGVPPAPEDDIFGRDNIHATARALALAARCTASFPFAFEPAFVPVGEDGDSLHPDMQSFASWSPGDGGVHSRYAVDGGLLANTPLAHALEAIARREADGPVRRTMLMVFPHAPEVADVPPDQREEPPTTAGALGGVLGALLAQGSRSFVERIKDHNRTAAEWQGSREQIISGLGNTDPVDALYAVLRASWPHYRHIRTRDAARGLADRVGKMEKWSYDRIREAAETAQTDWYAWHDRLPYVPSGFLSTSTAPSGPEDHQLWQATYLDPVLGWRWGDSAARGVVDAAAAVLRAALAVAPKEAEPALAAARRRVGEAAGAVVLARRAVDGIWLTNDYLNRLEPDRDYWEARIIAYELAMQRHSADRRRADRQRLEHLLPEEETRPAARVDALDALCARTGKQGATVWSEVQQVVDELLRVRERLESLAAGPGTTSGVHHWVTYLFAPGRADEPDDPSMRLVLRLLALDAGTRLLAESTTAGANLPVHLAELSLRVQHPWARFSLSPDDKAAGLALSRFGGFLKRSWRMNDWTWGRLDAATMLCQTVLDPRRLRRMATMLQHPDGDLADRMFALLRQELYRGAVLPETHRYLEKEARDELADSLAPDSDLRHLPALARWAALPLQADIILEELPVLGAAVKIDRDEGAGFPTRGTRFLLDHEPLLEEVGSLRDDSAATARLDLGLRCLRAFDSAGIGREELDEEAGSNALIRTASNAASVFATVVDAEAARIAPAVKPATSAVRGAMMLPHWVVIGLTSAGTIARFLATAGLVVGGVLLTLSLLGVLGSLAPAAGLVGAATILAALAYSALKTGSLLHAAALLAPVVPLVVFAMDASPSSGDAASRVAIVIGAVFALYLLANIPWPLRSPRRAAWLAVEGLAHALSDAWASSRASAARSPRHWLLALGAAVVVAGVLALTAPRWRDVDSWPPDWLQTEVGVATAFLVTVALGGLLAERQGSRLRAWRSDPAVAITIADTTASGAFTRKPVEHPSGVAASWAPVYGLLYLAAAGVALLQGWADADSPRWQVASVWWFIAVGAVLCLVAPVVTGAIARRGIEASVHRRWPDALRDRSLSDASTAGGGRLISVLLKYDTPYAYLLRPSGEGRRSRREATRLELTRRGRRLLRRLPQPPPALAPTGAPEEETVPSGGISAATAGAAGGIPQQPDRREQRLDAQP